MGEWLILQPAKLPTTVRFCFQPPKSFYYEKNIDFLVDAFWGLETRFNKLREEYVAQSKTITELQIKLAKQADIICELQSELYNKK